METFFDKLDVVKSYIPPAFYAPVAALTTVLVLWVTKRFLFYRLRKLTQHTKTEWDDIIIEALSFPANFLILASGFYVLLGLMPLSGKVDRFATMALQGCVIIAVVIFLDRLIKVLLERASGKSVFRSVSHGLTKGIARAFVIGIGLLIFLDFIGISITPILASLGIGSLAVALALQDTLSNFFAGLYVAVDRPVQEGDFVRLETGDEGYVIDVGWRNTRIRTPLNNVVIIPNSKLIGSVITNYHLPDKEMTVLVQMGVHYDSDLPKVERVTLEVAKAVQKRADWGATSSFEPMVRFHTFAESSINFAVVLRANEFSDQGLIKHEFVKALHDRYRKEGIVIPYPTRTVQLLNK
jgi:small-conductance mechanosensitive channel